MKKGLTLIELLVAISILTTLAAFLFPVYLKVRSRMHEISCANQLRQIGVAIRMYVKDYSQEETPYAMPIFLGALYPHYINDENLLICPRVWAIVPHEVIEKNKWKPHPKIPLWKVPESSYFLFRPKGYDDLARKRPDVFPFTFAEVFAKRGDQVPIAYCDAHRGLPLEGIKLMMPNPHAYRDAFITPGRPLIVLRWGGKVDFVFKGGGLFVDSDAVLVHY
ncbi:MAG: type II secretion system protein [Armatimonadota bacterium]|nr:type II secretion system protein [Armatimonadota bacterium]